MKVSLAALSAATLVASTQAVDLTVNIKGTDTVIPNPSPQEEYDQRQNHAGGSDVLVSEDGTSATLDGNLWKAFALPNSFVVNEDTVLKFDFTLDEAAQYQAICLDSDLEVTPEQVAGEGKRCFSVANTQGWLRNVVNSPHMTEVNETRSYGIPVGYYFNGDVNYIAFIQDNDIDRTIGHSIFSNIKIADDGPEHLQIEVNGAIEAMANKQLDYYTGSQPNDQDTKDFFLDISEDSVSIQISGNQWKALELPEVYTVTENTVLEFDFTYSEAREINAICLDDNLDAEDDGWQCFYLGGTQSVSTTYYVRDFQASEPNGQTVHYKIPVGMYYKKMELGTAQYLGFAADMDSGDKLGGSSTFSNFKLYDEPRAHLTITENGDLLTTEREQLAYSGSQDRDRDHIIRVSEDGKSVTMEGNMYRAMPLPGDGVTFTPATELAFTFHLDEITEVQAICFDDDLSEGNPKRCIKLSGTQGVNYFRGGDYNYDGEYNPVGETREYHIPVGLWYTGTFKYIVFVQDNDAGDRTAGKCTFSDIVLTERPSGNVRVAGAPTNIVNYQISYGGNQDSRERLVEVSEDGSEFTTRGNLWKAMPLEYEVSENTVLAFDFTLTEETEIHAICLDEDLTHVSYSCFKVAGTQERDIKYFTYQGIESTHEGETTSYMIRLKNFYTTPLATKWVAFVSDNDSGDRDTGIATYSNIRVLDATGCLSSAAEFEFSFSECTVDNFITKITEVMSATVGCGDDPLAELMAFWDLNTNVDVAEKIGDICNSAYGDNELPFNEVTGREYQFTEEYMDGGTTWNYERQSNGADLAKDAGRVKIIDDNFATSRAISWPDMHNYKGCALRAAMCCFVAGRPTEESEPMINNSDACYMDFSHAQQSSHVRAGWSIYNYNSDESDVEGDMYCHGFAWGNDPGYVESALKGNTLFNVAMKRNLYEEGNVEEIPGAPMCGCIEQMPTVTKAACTTVKADQTVTVRYDPAITEFVAKVQINSIRYEACDGDLDLAAHYRSLVDDGKATENEEALLKKKLVGEGKCPAAVRGFLSEKGLALE